MNLPKTKKGRETLLDIFQEVLEKKMGKGDRKKMLDEVAIFARANPKEFFKIFASLEPKNVKLQQEHKLMYVKVDGMKEETPKDLPTFNQMDTVVGDETETNEYN